MSMKAHVHSKNPAVRQKPTLHLADHGHGEPPKAEGTLHLADHLHSKSPAAAPKLVKHIGYLMKGGSAFPLDAHSSLYLNPSL